MKNLLVRTLSGAVYVALICCSLLFGQPYFFQSLMLIIAAIAAFEWSRLYGASNRMRVVAVLLASVAMCTPIVVQIAIASDWELSYEPMLVLYLSIALIAIIAELCTQKNNCRLNWGALLTSQLFCVGPFLMLSLSMTYVDAYTDIDYYSWLVLALFFIIWANDTGAYLVGSWIGKHKMAPKVSPKKTWEGFAGGAVLAILVGWLCLSVVTFDGNYFCNAWQAIAISSVVVVFATLGDLLESLIKRDAGVKDSGNIMPGHGGILDRFDSFILASVIYVPIVLVMLV